MSTSNLYRHLRSIALRGRSAKERLGALCAMVATGAGPTERLLDELLADPDLPAKITLWIAAHRTNERLSNTEEEISRRMKLKEELNRL